MNNKDVMVDSITEAWLLHEQGMDCTTYSIACTAGVLAVMNHLMDEQAAHEETKALLKERMAHQEGLEIRLGNAEKRKDEAIAARLSAVAETRRLQSALDARQTWIEELESRVARLENANQQQAELFSAAIAKRDAAIDCLKGGNCTMKRINWICETGFVGAVHRDYFDVEDDTSEDEINEMVMDAAFNHINIGWEVEEL